ARFSGPGFHLCLRFRQIACEITLTETSFIAIKYDASRRGRRRKRHGQGGVILASVRRSRSHVDKRRDIRMHTGFGYDHPGKRMTSTVGPSWRASTSIAEATASGSVVRGFCTAVTLSPAACNCGITSVQHDPSAKRPWTRTTFFALGTGCARAAGTRSELATAATVVRTKVRLFMTLLPFHYLR